MRRIAAGEEFRSNIHRGGSAEPVDLPPEYERTAIQAAQIMGLRVAGVDMLETAAGPKLMEVNSSPGLEGIERYTGIDVADAVAALIEEEVLFPEVDIRQRLTLSSGYGVMEIPIDEASKLSHRTLRDSRLRERDVLVLSILRGGLVIPAPGGDTEVLPGDLLLCYGKNLTLKGLAPKRAPASRKKAMKRTTEPPAGGS
jgi:ribosomal protein S6--L-glutamate ligase